MQETWGWSLGQEYPMEKEMATHSRILAWRIPWTEKTGRLQSMGSQRVGHDWVTFTFTGRPGKSVPLLREKTLVNILELLIQFFTLTGYKRRSKEVATGVRCILLWFWFSFPWLLVMLSIYPFVFFHLSVFFKKTSVQILCPFLIGLFFWYSVIWVLCIFWILTSYQIHCLQISSPIW